MLLLPGRVRAGSDPHLRWRVIKTPRVLVHYHQGLEVMARRVQLAAHEALDTLIPRLGWEPGEPLIIVVRDFGDAANGLASVVPRDRVEILAGSPDVDSALADHDDWMRTLVMHEVSHILHLGHVGGLPGTLNRFLGRRYIPNAALPRWLTEGLATYEETDRSSGGRARASFFDMHIRAEALERGLPGPDALTGFPTRWPSGRSPYLYGGRFMTWLARHHGEEGLARFVSDYGSRTIPFALNQAARVGWDRSVVDLWAEWQQWETDRAVALVAARAALGLTHSTRLTHHGYEAGDLRLSPDGRQLLYRRAGGDVVAHLYLIPLAPDGSIGGAVTELPRTGGGTGASWDPTDSTIVYVRRERFEQHYSFDDLRRHDPRTGDDRRLTRGMRASDPDVGPDGRIVCVAWRPNGSILLITDREGRTLRELRLPGVRELAGPRWSPDGRRIVVSGWRHGGFWDLHLVDPRGDEPVARLTRDRALDIQPAWTAGGSAILFASDRGGVYDLFSLDLADLAVRRVTRVVTGAMAPAPGPGWVLFAGYGADGFDVHRAPLALDGPLTPPDDGPADRPSVAISTALPTEPADEVYSPAPTILPRGWFPVIEATPTTSRYGVILGGSDAVGHHAYILDAAVRSPEGSLRLLVDYAYRRLYPDLHLTLARSLVNRRDALFAGGERQDWEQELLSGSAGLSIPLSGAFHKHSLSLRYNLALRRRAEEEPIEHDPGALHPRFPRHGVSAGLRAGWSYRDWERPGLAISPEQGSSLSLAVRTAHPAFLSEDDTVRATWTLRRFTLMPWRAHHVLSLRYAGGIGTGSPRFTRLFHVGGPPTTDVLTSVLDRTFVGGNHLRGYPVGFAFGDQEHLLNAEYRIPVAEITRGILTLPFYLDRVFAAAFADYGGAMGREFDEDALVLGLGGELRMETDLFYGIPVTFRLGMAQGVSEGGELQGYLVAGSVL